MSKLSNPLTVLFIVAAADLECFDSTATELIGVAVDGMAAAGAIVTGSALLTEAGGAVEFATALHLLGVSGHQAADEAEEVFRRLQHKLAIVTTNLRHSSLKL